MACVTQLCFLDLELGVAIPHSAACFCISSKPLVTLLCLLTQNHFNCAVQVAFSLSHCFKSRVVKRIMFPGSAEASGLLQARSGPALVFLSCALNFPLQKLVTPCHSGHGN